MNPAVLAARARDCTCHGTPAGEPCFPAADGDCLARYLDAYAAGAVPRSAVAAGISGLIVVDICAVITPPATPEGAMS
jgi:hypothetical protein